MWSTFFRDGGFGMYPVSIWGFLLVAVAVVQMLRPNGKYTRLYTNLMLGTVGSGLLGTSVGIINSFRYAQRVAPHEQFATAILGCAESMNCLVLALILSNLASVIAAVSAFRMMRSPQNQSAV